MSLNNRKFYLVMKNYFSVLLVANFLADIDDLVVLVKSDETGRFIDFDLATGWLLLKIK